MIEVSRVHGKKKRYIIVSMSCHGKKTRQIILGKTPRWTCLQKFSLFGLYFLDT